MATKSGTSVTSNVVVEANGRLITRDARSGRVLEVKTTPIDRQRVADVGSRAMPAPQQKKK